MSKKSIFILIVVMAAIIATLFIAIPKLKDDTDDSKDNEESSYSTEATTSEPEIIKDFVGLDNVEKSANVKQMFTYGTNLCISGLLTDSNLNDVENISLVLRRAYTESDGTVISEDFYTFPATITSLSTRGSYIFKSYSGINSGINLENIDNQEYCMLLKVTASDDSTTYYTLDNDNCDTDTLCYYTITKNNSNQKIDIGFAENSSKKYLYFNVADSKLPDDVYDIVLDPGHGGNDAGACSGGYCESELSIDYALKLKESLEQLGYKVKLTRDGTEPADTPMAYTMYDEDGRVNVAGASNAKICLSIHFNSNPEKLTKGGLQIFQSCKSDIHLSKYLLNGILGSGCSIDASRMTYYKLEPGIYARSFTNGEIKSGANEAASKGYAPYNQTTDTDYYFMIRELGGVATEAYVDGRNTTYGTNLYRDSKQGIETYILELGFISVDEDLKIITTERDKYVEGITEGLKEYIDEIGEKND